MLLDNLKAGNLGPYAKALNTSLVALLGVIIVVLPEGITTVEWITVGSTFLVNAVAVYSVSNSEAVPYAKAIVAGIVTAAGTVAAALLTGSTVDLPLILGAVVVLLNSFVVAPQTPNADESDNLVVHDLTDRDPDRILHEDAGDPGAEG